MGPLATVAEETGCAIILTRHPNKQIGAPAMYRGGGSLGIIGAARFGLTFGRDPQDPNHLVIAPVKCNIGPLPPSLGYRLEGELGRDHARVRWDSEPCDLTADDILAATTSQEREAKTATEHWLLTKLANGPRLATDLEADAEKEHRGWTTVKRAKQTLQVRSERAGFGKGSAVYWLLPGQDLPAEPDDTEPTEAHRGPSGTSMENADSMDSYGENSIEDHTGPYRADSRSPMAQNEHKPGQISIEDHTGRVSHRGPKRSPMGSEPEPNEPEKE
jgi:hypothetical protein